MPNGKIYTAPDMLEDPHFAAREAIVKMVHPLLGEFPMQNVAPQAVRHPWLGALGRTRAGGAHRRGAAELLGLVDGERDALRDAGII